MIEIYEEKSNMNTNPEIPVTSKATDSDMNQLRNAVLKGAYYDSENQTLIDQSGTQINPKIQQYEDFVNDYSNLFKFQHFSLPVYIGANANVSASVGQIHTPSGYTLLGILPLENGYSDQWQVTYSRYGTGVQAYIKSYHSSDLQATLQCVAVYVKTNYYNQNLVS